MWKVVIDISLVFFWVLATIQYCDTLLWKNFGYSVDKIIPGSFFFFEDERLGLIKVAAILFFAETFIFYDLF